MYPVFFVIFKKKQQKEKIMNRPRTISTNPKLKEKRKFIQSSFDMSMRNSVADWAGDIEVST